MADMRGFAVSWWAAPESGTGAHDAVKPSVAALFLAARYPSAHGS
ncbi:MULTISPECIES: hypothetical protein [unclassified Streptomyces]|nr:hypothetical protein [Streptomyces sp. CB02980]